jgi:membrane fusion protein (multidrug efflux system)
MKKHVFGGLAAILALAVCAGLIWFNFFRQEMIGQFFASQKPPSQVVSTTDVKPETWTPGIVAIGTARAAQGVQLAVQVNGIVKQIAFEANEKVNKDQLLVQLDDAVERADLIDAEAAVKVAQAAETRSRRLRKSGYDSEAAFDKVTADLDAALSKLARTKAAIELKSLEAPFSGTIGIPRIEVGEYVAAGTVVATLQDLDHIAVDFSVPEQFIAQVTMGQPVRCGFEEDKLGIAGKITGIDPRGDPQTRLVNVRADITDNGGNEIIPGRFLHVRINLPDEPGVIAVPQTSVVTSLYGDYVYKVVPDDREGADEGAKMLRQAFVKTGRREAQDIEILDGLAEGDVIVTAGQNKLQPGASVKVDNSVDITKAKASQQ